MAEDALGACSNCGLIQEGAPHMTMGDCFRAVRDDRDRMRRALERIYDRSCRLRAGRVEFSGLSVANYDGEVAEAALRGDE